ncbi:hypothetical protein ACIBCN_18660 [Nocardia sp. NPDC051052]|uniref:hypothetical protein n=1 Tax=Nocardia sp. NPDC051052 TaxID=3364322 RepID=UPI0037B20400
MKTTLDPQRLSILHALGKELAAAKTPDLTTFEKGESVLYVRGKEWAESVLRHAIERCDCHGDMKIPPEDIETLILADRYEWSAMTKAAKQ